MNRYADMTIWALREEMKTLQAELATRDVTPRPAQPVHATPETDAFYRKHPICEYEKVAHPSDCDAWLDFARDLERQLSLAQTENAGHIRIEDELKAELKIQDDANEILQRRLDEAQARCAELEKLLADVVKDRVEATYTLGTDFVDRIDSALKAAQNPGMNR